jgi:hypothetical protein
MLLKTQLREMTRKVIHSGRKSLMSLQVREWKVYKGNEPIEDFNGYWTKVTQVNTSGYFDDMLEEEAQKMYANKFGKRFLLVHWWKILKDEPNDAHSLRRQRKTKVK